MVPPLVCSTDLLTCFSFCLILLDWRDRDARWQAVEAAAERKIDLWPAQLPRSFKQGGSNKQALCVVRHSESLARTASAAMPRSSSSMRANCRCVSNILLRSNVAEPPLTAKTPIASTFPLNLTSWLTFGFAVVVEFQAGDKRNAHSRR